MPFSVSSFPQSKRVEIVADNDGLLLLASLIKGAQDTGHATATDEDGRLAVVVTKENPWHPR